MRAKVSYFRQCYDEKGYVIVRNAIDGDLATEMVEHMHWLAKKHPEERPERLHHAYMADDPFLHRIAGDKRLLDIAERFVGPKIALFASHYIAKQPHTGQAVEWHQDGTFWPLEPMEVTTLWVAATDSTVATGCMRVLPGTQNNRMLKPEELTDLDTDKYVLQIGIRPGSIDASDAVDIELKAGDVSIHNPNIIHGSNANQSDQWRVGLTLRYIPTSTKVCNGEHPNIMLRGEEDKDVGNSYVTRPWFNAGEHMPFRGYEAWS